MRSRCEKTNTVSLAKADGPDKTERVGREGDVPMFKTAGRTMGKSRGGRVRSEKPAIARGRTAALLLTGLMLVFLALCGGIGETAAGEGLIVSAAWKDRSQPVSLEGDGRVLRYCQPGWAVLETKDRELESLRLSGVSFEVVDTVREGRRCWLVEPAYPFSKDSLSAYGKLVRVGEGNVYLLCVDETLEPRLSPFVASSAPLPDRAECGTFSERGMPEVLRRKAGVVGLLATARSRFLGTVADEVNADSIRATVRFLSFDDDSGRLRTRFSFRAETFQMALWLREKLKIAINGKGTDSLEMFTFRYGGTTDTLYNVVGRIPGRVPGSGTFVVCAHYDSQGGRTVYPEPGRVWHWQTDPAPGADDNGSGVASVLECARVLSGLEFDFDIEFVLFCAEEQGLFGSHAYVETRKTQSSNILGALNFDMQAYRTVADTTFVRTNLSSDWLSNHIKTISESLFDSIGLRVGLVPVEGPYDASDHASFWLSGFDGVHFFEQEGFPVINPYYHTINDTAGTLSYLLAWRVASLGAASLAYFGTTSNPWDLEVLSGDLKFVPEGHTAVTREGSVGDLINVIPSFHNMGSRMPDTDTVRVSVYDGSPSSGWLIGERLIPGPIPAGGSPVIEPFSWLLTEGDVGSHSVYLVVDAGQGESNKTNNSVSKTFLVGSLSLAIRESFVFPNPSGVPPKDMRLRVFVTRNSELTGFDVYDVSGRRVGGCRTGGCGSESLAPGDNDVALSDVFPGTVIAPGVYLYRVSVDDGLQKKMSYGRFAVVR